MATKPTTIAQYIAAAPAAGQPQLRKLHALLKRVAPDAQEAIKWGTPFFVEPRFVFAFSAHKAHLSFVPARVALEEFSQELAAHDTTANMLRIPYDAVLPEDLVRRLAERSLQLVRERTGDSFW